MVITRKRIRSVLVITGVILLLVAAGVMYTPAVMFYRTLPTGWPAESFNTEEWLKTSRSERFRFYKDLAKRKLLDGAPKIAVVKLLGKPDYEAPDGLYVQYIVRQWSREKPILAAVVWIQINLDANGRAVGHSIRKE